MVRTSVRAVETDDGVHWEVARDVDADPDVVWELLVSPERWPTWGPTVGAVRCADETIARGTRGEVRVGGLWLPFTVDSCGDVGHHVRRWTWRVSGLRATGHRVETRDDGATRVVFEVPLWAMAYVAVCLEALRRIDREATMTRVEIA